MSSFSRRNGRSNRRKSEKDDDLLVFGYSCRLYPNDERSELLAGESHLQPWPGDETLLIDRFDCRLLLHSINEKKEESVLTAAEKKEEAEVERERWHDLHEAELAVLREEEAEMAKRSVRTSIGFSYDTPSTSYASPVAVKEDSDSEDELFAPPPGIKLPVGLVTPENQKLNHVIERTAVFVVQQGPQMEIVIKAKQRANPEQFGFLHFDHSLNPYYKYISKLIREKKYMPNLDRKAAKKPSNGSSAPERKFSALDAIAAQHGSDSDSDSDCELHPSLLAASRRGGSPDPVSKGDSTFSGPKIRPKSPPPVVTRSDYRIETANDKYGALFKSLSQLNKKDDASSTPPPAMSPVPVQEEEVNKVAVRQREKEEEDFATWFQSFYGFSIPSSHAHLPYIPPPPDLEAVVSSYARYVAENGPQAESALRSRGDLQLHFLYPTNRHHLYYLNTVRNALWERHYDAERAQSETQAAEFAAAVRPPPPPLNRKQRRSGFDVPQGKNLGIVPAAPSIVDPLALGETKPVLGPEPHMVKSVSSPVFLATVPELEPEEPVSSPPVSPSTALGGIVLQACPAPPTFTSNEPVRAATSSPAPTPPPPAISDIQTERQLKARLFMEKILNDKRKRKAEEEDAEKRKEEKTAEVTAMEEGEIKEVEDGNDKEGEKNKKRKRSRSREKKKKDEKKPALSTDFIDSLINTKMNELLGGTVTGAFVTKKEEEKKKDKSEEREKKSKKRSRSRERSKERERRKKERRRSRSRERGGSSSEDEKRRRRRRSRSRSSELPSRH